MDGGVHCHLKISKTLRMYLIKYTQFSSSRYDVINNSKKKWLSLNHNIENSFLKKGANIYNFIH